MINVKKTKVKKNSKRVALIISYIILDIFALAILMPFYIILITSLKESHALATNTPFVWWPGIKRLDFHAYKRLFTSFTISSTGKSMVLTGIINTLIVVIPTTVIGMFASSISAYSFAKINFKGKNFMFIVLLFSMMLPGIITLIPSYIIFDSFMLTNTYFPLMAPAMFGSAAGVFFLRQFFSGIPTELLEAGKLDGMGHIQCFFIIIVPLSLPAIFSQAILGFIAGYNDYLGPLLYINEERLYTLQIALQMFSSGNLKDLPTVMAGAVFALIPTIILYIFAQKYFIAGISMSGLKA